VLKEKGASAPFFIVFMQTEVFMKDFIQKQIESSERLYQIMMDDHTHRLKNMTEVYGLSESLQKKLQERDEEIRKLKRQLLTYESLERM
jgi:hypothetical protein